jgi:hypothetical protein
MAEGYWLHAGQKGERDSRYHANSDSNKDIYTFREGASSMAPFFVNFAADKQLNEESGRLYR